jgi:hypothetical protein
MTPAKAKSIKKTEKPAVNVPHQLPTVGAIGNPSHNLRSQ